MRFCMAGDMVEDAGYWKGWWELTCATMVGAYGNTSWIARFLVRCRGIESAGDPIDDSELDIREIVPRADDTAETDKFIAPTRLGRTVEDVEAPQESSYEGIVLLASRLLGLNLSTLGEKCCMLRARWREGAKSWEFLPYGGGIRAGGGGFMELHPYTSQACWPP